MNIRRRVVSILATLVTCLCMLPGMAFADSWERLAGPNAYDTMQTIVRSGNTFTPENVDTVIVATGDGYWDALAASGLAGRFGAPVLITPANSLATQTRDEIVRLAPSKVLVMGGPLAVSDACFGQIKQLCNNTERVYGPSAVDTAVEIYKKGSDWSSTAIVATSNGYWDALSIAPYAYAKAAPIFLTSPDNTLTASTASLIRENFSRVVIVGGPLAVASSVEGQLSGLEVKRLYGENAIQTSGKIANWELDQNMGSGGLCIATTNGYWDALTGASLAGAKDAIIVLTDPAGNTQAIDTAISSGASSTNGKVFGGYLAVSDDTYRYVQNYGKSSSGGGGTSGSGGTSGGGTSGGGETVTSEPRDYVLNNNTMKFHFPSCGHADRIRSYNRSDVHESRDTLIARGYEPCGVCHP